MRYKGLESAPGGNPSIRGRSLRYTCQGHVLEPHHCTHTTPCTASLHPKPACILLPEPYLHHGCTRASRRDNSGSLLGTHGGSSRDEPVGPPVARLTHNSAPQRCWLCKLPSGAPPGPKAWHLLSATSSCPCSSFPSLPSHTPAVPCPLAFTGCGYGLEKGHH